jgi:hypothetical protein
MIAPRPMPAQFKQTFLADIKRWGEMARVAGIKAE